MKLDLMREKSKVMPGIANAKAIDHLHVWFCSYTSLAPLRALTGLRVLQIAGFPDDTFNVIRGLRRLRYLQVIHLPHITDLSPLSGLRALESLELATLPSWDASGKVTTVRSLEPLARLPKLSHLELFGVRPRDTSLALLERCPRLKTARFSKYPKREIERFYKATDVVDDRPGIRKTDHGPIASDSSS